jgi:hypothetical protein
LLRSKHKVLDQVQPANDSLKSPPELFGKYMSTARDRYSAFVHIYGREQWRLFTTPPAFPRLPELRLSPEQPTSCRFGLFPKLVHPSPITIKQEFARARAFDPCGVFD